MQRGSIVIPAHNEAAVIGDCLSALFADERLRDVDVVVSCNGCDDETAAVVRRSQFPVRVVELGEPSKVAALRAAESVAAALPRLYVDADVVLPGPAAIAVLDRLIVGGALAARPPVVYDTSRSADAVRRFYRARSHAGQLSRLLCGVGVYGLSAAGRARFDTFPDVVGDDLFVDRLFTREEIEVVRCDPVVVRAPRTAADLVLMLRRSYRGKSQASHFATPPAPAWRTFGEIVAYGTRGRRQSLDAATYIGFAVGARVAGRLGARVQWERDNSSRAA